MAKTQQKQTFTPGPWHIVDKQDGCYNIFPLEGKQIDHYITIEDARIIAASPACYESLREVLQAFYEISDADKWTDDEKAMIQDAEKAIEQVEGSVK